MSKGDNRRPASITPQEYADNWERTFGSSGWPPVTEETISEAQRRKNRVLAVALARYAYPLGECP